MRPWSLKANNSTVLPSDGETRVYDYYDMVATVRCVHVCVCACVRACVCVRGERSRERRRRLLWSSIQKIIHCKYIIYIFIHFLNIFTNIPSTIHYTVYRGSRRPQTYRGGGGIKRNATILQKYPRWQCLSVCLSVCRLAVLPRVSPGSVSLVCLLRANS